MFELYKNFANPFDFINFAGRRKAAANKLLITSSEVFFLFSFPIYSKLIFALILSFLLAVRLHGDHVNMTFFFDFVSVIKLWFLIGNANQKKIMMDLCRALVQMRTFFKYNLVGFFP